MSELEDRGPYGRALDSLREGRYDRYLEGVAKFENEHSWTGWTRRELLLNCGIGLLAGALTGTTAALLVKSHEGSEDTNESLPPVAATESTTAASSTTSTSSPDITTEVPSTDPEQTASPERKTTYTLQEIADYTRTTVFAENDPGTLWDTKNSIEDALTLDQAKAIAASAIKQMTGRDLAFNIDPGTGKVMENNRKNQPALIYQSNLSWFIGNVARLSRKLASQPSSYNVFEEYLDSTTSDGRAAAKTNIGGMAYHFTDSDLLAIDVESLSAPGVLAHELMHIAEFHMRPDYVISSAYTDLRKFGAEQFGSVDDMYKRLAELAEKKEIDDVTYNLAFALAHNEDAGPDVRFEDAAYSLNTTLEQGILPESEDPLLQYLRLKQLQLITDMSVAAGVDYGAHIAFEYRFGQYTHPKTLASIAEAGILNHISPNEGGVFGSENKWSQITLEPGTHFVNIGTPEEPEIIVLTGSAYIDNSDGNEIVNGYFDIQIATDQDNSADSIDLNQAGPTTTTISEMGPPAPVGSVYPGVERILSVIAPQIVASEATIYGARAGEGIHTAPQDFSRPISRLVLSVNASDILGHIDPSRVIGKIGDNRLYESLSS